MRVILCLRMPQFMVSAGMVQNQLFVASFLDDLPIVKDGNLIAKAAGRETMADVNGSFILHNFVKL